MKSAEASLIEKYNKEFKETVEKLLEQEMQPDAAAANAADPTGPTVNPTDPMAATPATPSAAPTPEKKDVFSKVKSAFFDLEGDDEELITINFDGLKANPSAGAMASLEESLELELDEAYGMHGGADSYHGSTAGEEEEEELDESDSYEEEEEELEFELEEVVKSTSAERASLSGQAAELKKQAGQKEASAAAMKAKETAERAEEEKNKAIAGTKEEEELEETIELSEDELAELEESMRVDITNELEGYMGSTKRKKREFKNVAFAAARDEKRTEKREKMQKTIGDLQEGMEKVATKLIKEQELNNKLIETVEALKMQVEQTNLTNAKLLYTNKTLSSVSLNERQKQQIVENIAKADSVLEAKTIYETLQSAVASKQSEAPKSLSEAINRGNSPFLVRQKQTANINDMMSERMKLLAGIHSK